MAVLCAKRCGNESAADCSAACDLINAKVDGTGCGSTFEEMMSCYRGRSDQCSTTDTTCQSQESAYGLCVRTYCAAHSGAAACK
jgi:hypothetical protein